MKITNVEAMICDAGWRPWTFVKVQTDNGLTGYGECSDQREACSTSFHEFSPSLILVPVVWPTLGGPRPRCVE